MDFQEVSSVHQEEAQQADNVPDDEVQSSVHPELLVLGEVEEVAAEESDEITLIPPAPGGEVPVWQAVLSLPAFVSAIVNNNPGEKCQPSGYYIGHLII